MQVILKFVSAISVRWSDRLSKILFLAWTVIVLSYVPFIPDTFSFPAISYCMTQPPFRRLKRRCQWWYHKMVAKKLVMWYFDCSFYSQYHWVCEILNQHIKDSSSAGMLCLVILSSATCGRCEYWWQDFYSAVLFSVFYCHFLQDVNERLHVVPCQTSQTYSVSAYSLSPVLLTFCL